MIISVRYGAGRGGARNWDGGGVFGAMEAGQRTLIGLVA